MSGLTRARNIPEQIEKAVVEIVKNIVLSREIIVNIVSVREIIKIIVWALKNCLIL